MDVIDRANDLAAIAVEAKISVLASAPAEVEPVGLCLNCSEPVPDGLRWCDADCRNDWQDRRNRKMGRLNSASR